LQNKSLAARAASENRFYGTLAVKAVLTCGVLCCDTATVSRPPSFQRAASAIIDWVLGDSILMDTRHGNSEQHLLAYTDKQYHKH